MKPSEAGDDRAAMNPQGVLAAVVAAPLVAAVVFMSAVSLSGAAGIGPFKADPPRNPSEALVLRDPATAVWMFRTGSDPSAAYDVRLEMLSSGVDARLRPLVAAGYTGEEDIVAVVLREGATLPPDEARAAACWLASRGLESTAAMLVPPEWSPGDCPSAGNKSHK